MEDLRELFSKKDRNHQAKVAERVDLGPSLPHTQRQHRSEEAAKAYEYTENLHNEIDSLQRELSLLRQHRSEEATSLRGTILVLEESNKILHEENSFLRRDSERIVRESTMIGTRLSIAAEILLSLTKGIHDVETLSEATQKAVEAALDPLALEPAPHQEPRSERHESTS